MRRRLSPWLLAAAVATAGGCTRSHPDIADAERVLTHEVGREGSGLVRLVRVRATGRQVSTLLGARLVTLRYDAEIQFLGDACYGGGLSARAYRPPRYDEAGLPAAGSSLDDCTRVHVMRGDRREVAGMLVFESLGRGRWRGPDGQLY